MVAYGALPLNVFPVSPFLTKKETRIAMDTSVVISTYNSKRNIGNIENKGFKDFHCIVHAISKDITFVDDQISSTSDENQLEELVKKIKKIMASKKYGNIEELVIIDAIQRIGLEYYFRDEISAALEKHYNLYHSTIEEGTDNLHDLALHFRLLRQHGYHVSSDALAKFKDKNGNFNQELAKDINGLMSLFEASQFRTRSDYVLDDANKFSRKLLKASLLKNIEQFEGLVIGNTLRYPYHKSLPRLMAKKFLPCFKSSLMFLHDFNHINDWINEVHDLARIDINLAQISQQLELTQVSRWVNELNLEELQFARIEPLKWYMWSMGILPGLDMSEERLEIMKAISFSYMIDDIFDGYGTYDELYLFTEAIKRWETADVTQLPNCMKVCFKALLETTNDFSSKIQTKHGWNPEQFLRKLWTEQCNAFFIELKWSVNKYSPNPKEYLNNGIVSSGTHVVMAHAFFLLGKEINKKSLKELSSLPSIISSTATILRLWNDVGNHMDKTPNGEDGSYVDWYMKEHKISSYDIARKHVSRKISDAWKCINKEYMSSTSPFSKEFKEACLNLARTVPIMYSQDESDHFQFMVEP
ncbi:(3S,6E)-nerolidol synthase 1-like [Chenopodium quinoa]|uniref:(3S,6E)-nerolidol synthase 1-like n=1 Tax=Chenopodium quinoa TaxID=63459 RepID=UPI000B797C88|nr:(3S,6E)-nerolidol synthase 1-like [Chenopodium quinoa]